MRKLFDHLDPHYAKICLYAGVTVLLTLVAGMVLYFSSGFFANLWLLICAVLEPAIYGALIAYLLNPLVVRVSHALKRAGWQRGNCKVRRLVGVIASLLAIVLVVLGIIVVMTLVITRSLEGINIDTLRQLWNDAQADIMRLVKTLAERAADLGFISTPTGSTTSGADLVSKIAGMFKSVANTASTMLFSVIFSIYYLLDGSRVSGYLLRVVRAVVGEQTTAKAMDLLDDADHVFSGYIRGQFTDALVVGILAAVGLTAARVPFGPIIGLLTGVGNLIPYLGAPVGIVSTILVCIADDQLGKIVIGVPLLVLIMFIDSNVINPKLLSDNVEVHPLLVVAALIAGGAVGGLAGMLVAVPAAAFLKIQLDRWLAAREAGDSPERGDRSDEATSQENGMPREDAS